MGPKRTKIIKNQSIDLSSIFFFRLPALLQFKKKKEKTKLNGKKAFAVLLGRYLNHEGANKIGVELVEKVF